ncbi:hypothetical protein [Nocardioides sp. W7]|uniref:hypothetical protein n=1 Tax=Nocardioides sp. W7 TaxID=2931390 RepID=UPI001FD243CE|nr:hypothetical protein [Nocardioides sp. W7]
MHLESPDQERKAAHDPSSTEGVPQTPVPLGVRGSGPSSRTLLQALAQPKAFEGPRVPVQERIVEALETTLPLLDSEAKPRRDEIDGKIRELRLAPGRSAQEKAPELAELEAARPPDYLRGLLYLGSIVLTEVPATEEDLVRLISTATMEATDNSQGSRAQAPDLPRASGTERDIIDNTLRTMEAAGQLEYLRESGIVGPAWKLVVEVHYYSDRGTISTAGSLHKDTEGQTLFVNLNYINSEPIMGPEYVVNPPTVAEHEEHIGNSLPKPFLSDLGGVRELGDPTTIGTTEVPVNGVVSFVDEAVHHATPLTGHRTTTAAKLQTYLRGDPTLGGDCRLAEDVWGNSRPTDGFLSWFTSPKSFRDQLPSSWEPDRKARWETLMDLCSRPTEEVSRPVLKDCLESGQIDELMSRYGPEGLNSVNIPHQARTVPQGAEKKPTGRYPLRRPEAEQNLTLSRRASSPDLLGKSVLGGVGGKRSFFRTWVRAVPVKPQSEANAK